MFVLFLSSSYSVLSSTLLTLTLTSSLSFSFHRFHCFVRFTRDLLTKQTTHLIAQQAGGAKYDEAIKHSQSIQIVSPHWLESCHAAQKRLSEDSFCIPNTGGDPNQQQQQQQQQAEENSHMVLVKECQRLGTAGGTIPPNPLFAGLYFYWVGFDDDEEEDNGNDNGNGVSTVALKQQLMRLVRRSMGTILWDVSDRITHVVVCQNCNRKAR